MRCTSAPQRPPTGREALWIPTHPTALVRIVWLCQSTRSDTLNLSTYGGAARLGLVSVNNEQQGGAYHLMGLEVRGLLQYLPSYNAFCKRRSSLQGVGLLYPCSLHMCSEALNNNELVPLRIK
eukprot:4079285-Amphidinium_carterae.1